VTYCTRCGARSVGYRRFCAACGARIVNPVESNVQQKDESAHGYEKASRISSHARRVINAALIKGRTNQAFFSKISYKAPGTPLAGYPLQTLAPVSRDESVVRAIQRPGVRP
jgi:hypothetical protein